MNRRNATRATMALLCFAIALPAGDGAAQQKTLKDQLVGAWTQISLEITPQNSTKEQRFGTNAKGILILDASGRYAWVGGNPDRPKFKASGNFRLDTPAAEWGEAAKEFGAHFGTWSVNEADKTLTSRYEGALIPNNEGRGAQRVYQPGRG